MFEDCCVYMVGDMIIIVIIENMVVSKQIFGSVNCMGSMSVLVLIFVGMNVGVFFLLGVLVSDVNKFDSKGVNGVQNNFMVMIMVMVVEVLGNGNLVVSGEKQMVVGQGIELIKFFGVVNLIIVNN